MLTLSCALCFFISHWANYLPKDAAACLSVRKEQACFLSLWKGSTTHPSLFQGSFSILVQAQREATQAWAHTGPMLLEASFFPFLCLSIYFSSPLLFNIWPFPQERGNSKRLAGTMNCGLFKKGMEPSQGTALKQFKTNMFLSCLFLLFQMAWILENLSCPSFLLYAQCFFLLLPQEFICIMLCLGDLWSSLWFLGVCLYLAFIGLELKS